MTDEARPATPLRVLELHKAPEPAALDYTPCSGCEYHRDACCHIDPPRAEIDDTGFSRSTLPPDCAPDRPACWRYLARGSRAKETR